jgi:hypothetical protein
VPDGVAVAFVLGVEDLDGFVLGVKELDADESKPHPVSSFSASTGPGVFSFYDWPDDGRTPARGLRRVDQIAIGGVRVCDAVA